MHQDPTQVSSTSMSAWLHHLKFHISYELHDLVAGALELKNRQFEQALFLIRLFLAFRDGAAFGSKCGKKEAGEKRR